MYFPDILPESVYDGKMFYDISLEVDDAKVPGAKKHVSHIKSSTSTNNYTQNGGNVNSESSRKSKDLAESESEGVEKKKMLA